MGQVRRRAGLWAIALILSQISCFERGRDEPRQIDSVAREQPGVESARSEAALRSHEPKGDLEREAHLRLRLQVAPTHLNPILSGDVWAVQVTMGDVYEGLLGTDRPGQAPVTRLGELVAQDGRVFRFRLRQDVLFHDGAELSPADVVASYELARRAGSPLATELDDLQSIRAVEGDIELRFADRRPDRIELFTRVPILRASMLATIGDPSELRASELSRKPVGTGPLRLRNYTAQSVELERFADYWGQPAGAATIEWKILPDQTRAIAELRAGELDAIFALPVESALEVAKDSRLEAFRSSMPAYTAAVFNVERPQLRSAEVRRALADSLDRKTIVRELFAGHGQVAIGPFEHGSPRHDPEEVPASGRFDLEARRERLRLALRRAGADDEPRLQLLVPAGSRLMERLADLWAADLRPIVTLEVNRLPYSDLLDRVRAGDFDITLLSFSTSAQVDLFSLFHSSQVAASNLSRVADPELDALLVKARSAGDEVEVFRALHRRLLQLAPFGFITTDVRLGVADRLLGGVGDTARQWGARGLYRVRP